MQTNTPKTEDEAFRAEMAACVERIAASQDASAFETVFAHYGPRVKAFLMSRGLEQAAADELAQDVMLTLWTKAHLYKPEKASVSTWIFTIARNRMIDERRSRGRKSRIDPHDPMLHPEPETQPDEQAERGAEDAAVTEALASLPENQAQILRLSFMEGHSHHVIAERLGLPLGTVKSRIRLAKDRLKVALEN